MTQPSPAETMNGYRDGPGPVQGGVFRKTPLAGGTSERQRALGASISKAVRLNCLDCAAGNRKHIKFCPADGLHARRCPLWLFRFGVRPETARKRYGADFLDPKAMPDADANLDDLR